MEKAENRGARESEGGMNHKILIHILHLGAMAV